MNSVEIDSITFEVLRHALSSIVEEAGVMLERTALNPVINEGLDFACSFSTADGRIVAQGKRDLLAFIGVAPIWVKNTIEWIGLENFHEGDVIIVNDPYLGGTHCQDVKTLMPIFWQGDLVAFVQNAAHWIDCGGPIAGSYNPRATHAIEEAFIITPVHIMREGVLDENVLRLILRNVREPDTSRGDLMGQIRACQVGEERLHGLIKKYGKDLILAEMEELISYSEKMLRAEFAKIPDGTYTAIDFIDCDPTSDSDAPIKIQLDLTVQGDRAIYDFSKSDPQVNGGVNGPKSVTISGAMLATKSMFPHIPMNEGIYNAIDWVIPDGLVVSATYPAPISGMASTVVSKAIDNVYQSYIQIVPEMVMCAENNLINIIFNGYDSRPGHERPWILYMWLDGGWGARPAKKDNFTGEALFASTTKNIPIERYERDNPVVFRSYGFLQDSEGAGMHRGGFGVEKSLYVVSGNAKLATQGDRGKTRPWGAAGGHDGPPNTLTYAPGTDEETDIGVFASGFPIEEQRIVRATTSGGGGYGRPLERPIEWVLEDVIDGLVSLKKAREVYGVEIVVGDRDVLDFSIDNEETMMLRQSLRARDASTEDHKDPTKPD